MFAFQQAWSRRVGTDHTEDLLGMKDLRDEFHLRRLVGIVFDECERELECAALPVNKHTLQYARRG